MSIISEANSNGTLQVTIPIRAAEALGWEAGTEITPLIIKGKRSDGSEAPFALLFHKPRGSNGVKLKMVGNVGPLESEPA